MDLDNSIREMIRGVQAGDDEAARAIWNRYFPQLVRLAGKRLIGQRRQAEDEEDVAIRVMESFFRAARQGRFPDLHDSDGIWRLLARMTSQRVIDLIRRNAVRPVADAADLADQFPGMDPLALYPDDDPTPRMLAMLADETQHLLDILPEKYRPLALKKLECMSVAEMAQHFGVHISTIERRLRIIRGFWEKERRDAE